MSPKQHAVGKPAVAVSGGGKSKYAILADLQEDTTANLEFLKQQIKNISCGPATTAHEKAHIKLEKGQKLNGGPKMKEGINLIGSQKHKDESVDPTQPIKHAINPSGEGKGPIQPQHNAKTHVKTSRINDISGCMQRMGQIVGQPRAHQGKIRMTIR